MNAPARELATIVKLGDYEVAMWAGYDDEGNPYVEVEGQNCNLDGVLPGIYYPTALKVDPVTQGTMDLLNAVDEATA